MSLIPAGGLAGQGWCLTEPAIDSLREYRFINLTTYKRDGSPVTSPMWFARCGSSLVIRTAASTAKVKRLRRNRRVEVAASTRRGAPRGPALTGTARFLTGDERRAAWSALDRRYRWQARLVDLLFRWRRDPLVLVEITID